VKQISEAEYERLKRLAGEAERRRVETPRLPPPRPATDPRLELTAEHVDQMGCRGPHSVEARLMRDWLRMHRRLAVWTEHANWIRRALRRLLESDGAIDGDRDRRDVEAALSAIEQEVTTCHE
jgi:hypothetical protein